MKLSTRSVTIITTLASIARIAMGRDCNLPTYTGMLSATDSSIAPLYCSLPTREIQDFTETVFKTAVEINALPPNNFLSTCFPAIFGGLASKVAGMSSSVCQPGETAAYPYVKLSNGFATNFVSWLHTFCVNFDTCDKASFNRYLATMFLQAHLVFGETRRFEYGWYVYDHIVPSFRCSESLRLIMDPEAFCSGAAVCSHPSLVDVSVGYSPSVEVAICNDGCSDGVSADLSEEEILKVLNDLAGYNDYTPFCAGSYTPVSVQRSSKPFDVAEYCQSRNARQRTWNC